MFDKLDLTETALITDSGRNVSGDELFDLGIRMVGGIPERCLVFLECSNTVEGVAAYSILLIRRIVPLLLGKRGGDETAWKERVVRYRPSYMLLKRKENMEEESESLFGKWLAADEWVVEENGIYYEKVARFETYDLWENRHQERTSRVHPDLALLLPTSGTTGESRYVRVSYQNLISNTESIMAYQRMNTPERGITSMPMSYAYGLSIVNTTLACGGTLLVTERRITDSAFWEFFARQRATTLGGVPYAYEVLDRMGFFNRTFPNLRTLTQAGGKLSRRMQKKIALYAEQRDIRFYLMYGQTEATARMTYLPPEMALKKPGSAGIPIPDGSISLMPEDGEICYTGPNVTMGYAENGRDLEKGDENGGVLYTGDLGTLDEDGFLYIIGRKKRIAKICGYRINLMDLEEALRERYGGDFVCREKENQLIILGTEACIAEKVMELAAYETGLNRRLVKYCRQEGMERNENGKLVYRATGEEDRR